MESTIGGNVAENAGYTRAVKYGVTRDYILGLEAVMPDGEIIRAGGRTVKNVTGYDLVSLLVGSEGTLAVICKIICRLLPKPAYRNTCVFYLDDLVTASELVVAIFRLRIIPCAIEFMDGYTLSCVDDYLGGSDLVRRHAAALVLVEVDGNHEEVTEAEARAVLGAADTLPGVLEARLAATKEEAERLWRVRREALPALKSKGRDHLEADVVVPRYRLPSLAQAVRRLAEGKRVTVATYGHARDGNLHVTIQYRSGSFTELEEANTLLGEIYRETIAMDGRLTGEHGVGLTVKDYLHLQLSPEELALLRRIKQAFDPEDLLNPGKIFPDEEY